MADIEIKSAKISDLPAIRCFLSDLVAEGLDTISRRDWTEESVAAWLEPKLDPRLSFVLLALEGAQVVGLLDVTRGAKPHNQHVAALGLSVASKYRNRGLGARLMRDAIAKSKTWAELCRIELECAPWNAPAPRLYKKFGFEIEATRRKGVNLRGLPEDDLAMALVW